MRLVSLLHLIFYTWIFYILQLHSKNYWFLHSFILFNQKQCIFIQLNFEKSNVKIILHSKFFINISFEVQVNGFVITMLHNCISPDCAAQSVGAGNQLFLALIQTILTTQCSLSPADKWPRDCGGAQAYEGVYFHFLAILKFILIFNLNLFISHNYFQKNTISLLLVLVLLAQF